MTTIFTKQKVAIYPGTPVMLSIMRVAGKGQRILLSTALISRRSLSSTSTGKPLHDEMHFNSLIIFLGREIFENPVSLNCSHCYCKECLIGLKRSSSSASEDSDELEDSEERILKQSEATPAARSSIIYTPQILEPDLSFSCAICREVSNGYTDSRDLTMDLETTPYQCPHCSTELVIGELRQHQETCVPAKKKVDVEEIRKALASHQVKNVLSEMQRKAREEAREGQNRSTFPCPFCSNANFTVKDLLKHIEREHANADQHQVCPVCAAMPWGDKTLVSRHVYGHLKSRHLFNYETYVNYEQDEETMIALAIEKSLGIE